MSKITINPHKQEITKNYIAGLLEQLTLDYRNTKAERKNLASTISPAEEEFSILEEIELLTVNIRGYASQIQARGAIDNHQEAIDKLQKLHFWNMPAIAQFYLTSNREYQQLNAYIRTLDYLRLLILEYLS